jgi:hypothetical protein
MKRDGDDILITAPFELRTQIPYLPSELWYRFPVEYEKHLSPRADGFAATALLVSMFAGEDLTIRGPLSPRLAYSLLDLRGLFHAWEPRLYKMVDLKYEQLQALDPIDDPPGIGAAFSGGIDSFYTLWAHLPENQAIPSTGITHGLFVRGLDLRLDNEGNYRDVAEQYAELLRSLDIELITAATNAYQFAEFRIAWTLFFGPPLIGAALLLSPLLRRFYIPSGIPYPLFISHGSSPLVDHHQSTEQLEVIHHGAWMSRLEKLEVITQWPATYHQLRVCTDKERQNGIENCSACDKCYRTITGLVTLDALPNYKNFSQKLTFLDYLRWGLIEDLNPRHVKDLAVRARQIGKPGLSFMVRMALFLSKVKVFFVNIVKRILTPEQLYRLKRRVYHPETGDSSKDDPSALANSPQS